MASATGTNTHTHTKTDKRAAVRALTKRRALSMHTLFKTPTFKLQISNTVNRPLVTLGLHVSAACDEAAAIVDV